MAPARDHDARPAAGGPQVGDTIEVAIHELGHGGVGVGKLASGLVCLVPRTLPGEVVQAEVVRRKAKLAHARVRAVLLPSPQRVLPPCAHFDVCGGCHLQHLGYAEQLAAKHAVLTRNLARALGPDLAGKVAPVVPSPLPLGYRNRSFYHVAEGRLGFVDPLTEAVVGIERCLVAAPAGERAADAVRAWLHGAGRALRSFVLDVLVRANDGQALCVLVVAAEDIAAGDVRRWLGGEEAARLAPLRLLAEALSPGSLWVSCKPRARRAMFGDDVIHLSGEDHILERVGPFELVLSPTSFAQANPGVAALLYGRAVDALAPGVSDTVLDLYCGTGALSFHLAKRAGHVDAVEMDHRALADARRSAARNGLANLSWRGGKCEVIGEKLARAGARYRLAAVNPPRTGLHDDVPAQMVRLGVERLAYVSCSPPTLARDLARLGSLGFMAVEIVPFDMFAQTYHLETLVLLVRAAAPAGGGRAG